jgi:hypothetical protein
VTPTDEELVLAAGHVSYELTQMVDVAQLLPKITNPPVTNALLESVLLHARGLIEFVLDTGRESDIRAKQFDPDWKLRPKPRAKSLRKLKKAIDQHLAHLTWARVKEGQRPWEYDVVADVVDAVRDFTATVEKSKPHLVSVIRGALTKIDQQAMQTPSLVEFVATTTNGAYSGAGTAVAWAGDPLGRGRPS